MVLLQVEDLFAGYGETEILHGVSAVIDAGEMVTVIGPNGAGKSTLIKTIIGILRPTKGAITFRDRDIAGRSPEELVTQGIAYIPQNSNIFPTLTVLENFEMGAISRRPGKLHLLAEALYRHAPWKLLRGTENADQTATLVGHLTEQEFRARVAHVTDIFPNLEPKLGQKARSLSGGEQQMVALGKGLILDPVLLLIDEPSAGLAPTLVTLIFEKIQEINEHGTAILLVEQNAKKALAMANRGYVLDMGRNRYEGSGKSLLIDPEVGRLYLGG